MKSLRISVVIIIAFLICWTPYYVMMIIFLFWNPDKKVKLKEDANANANVIAVTSLGHFCAKTLAI